MTISVRLERSLYLRLKRLAEEKGRTNSDILRECLTAYLSHEGSLKTPWELGKDVFGKYKSGRSDLSTRAEEIVKEGIIARAGRRRHRSPRRPLRSRG